MAVTPERMRDARDAEDALLLEKGDHAPLLAAWHDVILQRCLIAVRGDPAYDVAQDVCLRLLGELRRGKRYPVPYRVVVHKVVSWTIKDHVAGRPTHLPLPDDWDPPSGDDPYRAFEEDYDLERLLRLGNKTASWKRLWKPQPANAGSGMPRPANAGSARLAARGVN